MSNLNKSFDVDLKKIKHITDSLSYLIRDIARAKYNTATPSEQQLAFTECDFMIWLGDTYRKSRKIKRSK